MKTSKKCISTVLSAAMLMLPLGACVNSEPAAPASSVPPVSSAAASTAPADTSEGVKIGFVWPLTGGSATIGQQHNDGALMAIEEINANGGVKSMGGAKIIPVTADSETKPDVGSTQVERLITKENVSIVVGCYNSAVTFPAAEVAQRYSTPFISQGGVKNEITERGYDWVFRVNNKATYDVEEMLKGIDLISEENGVEMKTYALIYESTDWGSDNAKIWKSFADERGWTCVLDEPVTVGQADMSSRRTRHISRRLSPRNTSITLYRRTGMFPGRSTIRGSRNWMKRSRRRRATSSTAFSRRAGRRHMSLMKRWRQPDRPTKPPSRPRCNPLTSRTARTAA